MKRKDCYFGLHFDFHANEETKNIGKNFDANILEKIITEVKPDFVQCDTKGHPGISSYPTKVGNPCSSIDKDILKQWRTITEKHDVLLFAHHSGIWDTKVSTVHPEWALIYEDGSKSNSTSIFSEYKDKILIPQLKEIALDYKLDGAWVDGECWALGADFSENGKKAFKALTGKELTKIDDEILDFTRKEFLKYVNYYIKEIKNEAPNFEITSNWLNTSWVPDPVCITDYISGDLSPTNAVNAARFDARLIESFGRNWDIMSWGISYPIHFLKSDVQLMQEAAPILALGGGYQVYNMQSATGTIENLDAINQLKSISNFVSERKEYCFTSKQIPDIGIFYSSEANYKSIHDAIFKRDSEYNKTFSKIMLSIANLGKSVSVIHAEAKNKNINEFKIVVVPNTKYLNSNYIDCLLQYASNGGNLMLQGVDTLNLFKNKLKLVFDEPLNKGFPICTLSMHNCALECRCNYVNLKLENSFNKIYINENKVYGDIKSTNPPPQIITTKNKALAFATSKYNKGTISYIPLNIEKLLDSQLTYELGDFLDEAITSMKVNLVNVNPKRAVEVYLSKKNSKQYLHLINLQGDHSNEKIATFDYIPECKNIKVSFRDKLIVSLKNVLTNEIINKKDDCFTIESLKIYDIFEIIR